MLRVGRMSGGQKQRLSIARAIAKNPDIYIFDDSFSALDMKTDAKLREALKPITREAVTLIVAQRISTIKDADQIVVLNNGTVVGKGAHYELLHSCGVYREIAKSQLSEAEFEAELARGKVPHAEVKEVHGGKMDQKSASAENRRDRREDNKMKKGVQNA